VEAAVRIERVIDLPRAIVDDAFIDPVLVEGWLHPVLRLADFPDVRLSSDEVPGGTRGTSTRVTVEVALPDPRFEGALRQTWQTRLDQLENLLRGHPTVWQVEQSAPARTRRAN
jgi:uncharacterized protein YndB with AHSA1/START domain